MSQLFETYRWINDNLPDYVAVAVERFLDEDLVAEYPDDVVEVFTALAQSTEPRYRALAAIGLHNVMLIAPDEARVMADALLHDEDPEIVNQTHETLAEMPRLLEETRRRAQQGP